MGEKEGERAVGREDAARKSAPAQAVAPYTAQRHCSSSLDRKELLERSCTLTGSLLTVCA